jgi:hypothetical protein
MSTQSYSRRSRKSKPGFICKSEKRRRPAERPKGASGMPRKEKQVLSKPSDRSSKRWKQLLRAKKSPSDNKLSSWNANL